MSGDEHISSLKIDGEETQEAVRECGSEVPIDVTPKPWYHFTRWEEREEKPEEEERDDTPWGL